jgi:hypothetical protein
MKRVTGPDLTGTAHQRPFFDSAVVPIAAPTMPFSRISTAPKSARLLLLESIEVDAKASRCRR